MSTNSPETVKPEDREALKRLVRSPALAGFIVYEVMTDPDLCPTDGPFTLEQVKEIGWAIARATELVATSVATGDWGVDQEQEAVYASQIEPWLHETGQDSLKLTLYGPTAD